MIGRYCEFKSYQEIYFSCLKGEYKDDHDYISANFRACINSLAGSLELALNDELGEKLV